MKIMKNLLYWTFIAMGLNYSKKSLLFHAENDKI